MKFTLKRLIFIIILTSISNISLSHEFWIDPKNYHLSNEEKFIANIFIGENFEGSPIPFTKEYFKISFLHSKDDKSKIKGRLGDIPALNIKKMSKGLNVIQIESVTKYVEYQKLVKFEIFAREKGYPDLAQKHKENNYPENFFESYKRYAKSLISVENFDGKDIDTNMDFELIFLDNPLKNLNESKRILLEYKNKILTDHKVSIMSLNNGYFRKEYLRTNEVGYFDYFFKENTKYLIESVVIIEGSNKKKDNYAKWHSLWTSYTLKTPNK
ncbi:DUF4198 domain-containing protein [Pelagibacteraceae bacterium]|nr:DUF4198 domain-containing protein [Pelagibacteraceae bacterium]